jgi:hypothetical protein
VESEIVIVAAIEKSLAATNHFVTIAGIATAFMLGQKKIKIAFTGSIKAVVIVTAIGFTRVFRVESMATTRALIAIG